MKKTKKDFKAELCHTAERFLKDKHFRRTPGVVITATKSGLEILISPDLPKKEAEYLLKLIVLIIMDCFKEAKA